VPVVAGQHGGVACQAVARRGRQRCPGGQVEAVTDLVQHDQVELLLGRPLLGQLHPLDVDIGQVRGAVAGFRQRRTVVVGGQHPVAASGQSGGQLAGDTARLEGIAVAG